MIRFRRNYFIERIIRASERNKLIVKKKKYLRICTDIFDIPCERFRQLFRLPKVICQSFIEEVSPFMNSKLRNTRLSKQLRVLIALQFFAQGSYQLSVGQNFLLTVSQSTVSRCVREICSIMDQHLLAKYVRFPTSYEDFQKIKQQFYENFHLPGVIGAIDGTHIKLKGPGGNIGHVYVCREGGHSINVQVVCTLDLRIIDCNARFGGTANDASVWRASALRVFLQQKYSSGERNFYLVGDSGYPQLPYLMTPIQGAHLTEAEENYNIQHRKTRSCIERCFKQLKSRFRCLSRERMLCYNPITAGKIINSCIILHNILIENGIVDKEIEDIDHNENSNYESNTEEFSIGSTEEIGFRSRNLLVHQYFSDLS